VGTSTRLLLLAEARDNPYEQVLMSFRQQPTAPAQGAPFAAMLRTALAPSTACGLAAVVVLWLLRGPAGGLAAIGGVATAVVFFAAGLLVMRRLAGDNPLALVASALAVFLGQVIFLGIVILVLGRAAWLDGVAFGVAILVVALAWQVFQVVAFRGSRQPVYAQHRPADGGADDAAAPDAPTRRG